MICLDFKIDQRSLFSQQESVISEIKESREKLHSLISQQNKQFSDTLNKIVCLIQKNINNRELTNDALKSYILDLRECLGDRMFDQKEKQIKTFLKCCIVLAKHSNAGNFSKHIQDIIINTHRPFDGRTVCLFTFNLYPISCLVNSVLLNALTKDQDYRERKFKFKYLCANLPIDHQMLEEDLYARWVLERETAKHVVKNLACKFADLLEKTEFDKSHILMDHFNRREDMFRGSYPVLKHKTSTFNELLCFLRSENDPVHLLSKIWFVYTDHDSSPIDHSLDIIYSNYIRPLKDYMENPDAKNKALLIDEARFGNTFWSAPRLNRTT